MFLPSPGGRFPVGATTFKLSVPRRVVGDVRVRSGTSSEFRRALVLEEVSFTAFYPADVPLKSSPKGLAWLLRVIATILVIYRVLMSNAFNFVNVILGLSLWVLWPLVYLFGALLRIPVHPGAPLLNPHDITRTKSSKSSPWPLVVYSHGLGGSRTAYSQLCTRIASSGRVVLAMEHRDGSGHAAVPSSSDPIPYINEASLIWPSNHPEDERNMLSFRGEQLDFRRREIYHALRAIRNLVRGGREDVLVAIGDANINWSRWSGAESKNPIECEKDIVLAGHSFGGATVLSILSSPPSENEPLIPVQKALIFDPWLEPLPPPGPLPHHSFRKEQLPSILVINSEQFTLWSNHFERLVEVGQSWTESGWELLTIVGCEHISFSDFRILPLISSRRARLILNKVLRLSLAFLDDDEIRTVASPSAKMEIKVIGKRADGRPKRQIVGDLCDIISH